MKHPLLRARCDGDQSVSIRGHHNSNTETVQYDFKATFVFVALHSAAVLTIDVIQSLELATRMIGKVENYLLLHSMDPLGNVFVHL